MDCRIRNQSKWGEKRDRKEPSAISQKHDMGIHMNEYFYRREIVNLK